jgi:hypothetical protein
MLERWQIRKGTKVVVEYNPVSRMLYGDGDTPPANGTTGTVEPMNIGAGKRVCFLPGPAGGLVYVKLETGEHRGLSRFDLSKR